MFARTYAHIPKRRENKVTGGQQPITVTNERTVFLPVLRKRHEFQEIKQNRAIFVRMKKSKDFIKVRRRLAKILPSRKIPSHIGYCTVLYFIPCLEKYSQSEARITVAYSAVCNG